ncbi:MAG: hypothetical protein M1818_008167 [Claussenomyces sp. TS43310]|nr:MAG: hypothetical protein M1818_008167 [Claussenomyces sp. TS43310]
MSAQIVRVTVQSCLLAATSNILAQFITAYRSGSSFQIDWTTVLQFILFAALNGPPNYLWQQFLESTFPGFTLAPSSNGIDAASHPSATDPTLEKPAQPLVEPRRNLANVAAKFLCDQTVGAALNTLAFSLAMAGFRGASPSQALQMARQDFWPLVRAGWKLWPAVSLVNFTLLTSVEARTLLGSLAGMAWTVYLSLVASGR